MATAQDTTLERDMAPTHVIADPPRPGTRRFGGIGMTDFVTNIPAVAQLVTFERMARETIPALRDR